MSKIFFVAILSIFISGCGGDGMEAMGVVTIKTPTPISTAANSFVQKNTNTPLPKILGGVTLVGKVINKTTEQPIPFAPIIFGGKITQADEKGNYSAENIKPDMRVIVFADGYQELDAKTTILDLNTKRKDFYLKKKEGK